MAVVATAELEGSSNVSNAWSADLERARTRLDEFGKQAGNSLKQPGDASKSALQSVNGLYNGMQALAGSAIITGAARLGSELFQIGGAAQEAKVNLNALTGGQLDAYLSAVNEGADGMISNLNAMSISSKALNAGLELTAEQIGEISEASTIFADVSGKSATETYETLVDAIGRGNMRMLQQFGIIAKGKDMQLEINKVIAANSDLTYTQASQIAALNLVNEKANDLQKQGVGSMSSASDASERFSATIENAKTDVGEWLANGLMPWIDGVRGVNKAFDEQKIRVKETSETYDEYISRLSKIQRIYQQGPMGGGTGSRQLMPGVMSESEFYAAQSGQRRQAMDQFRAGETGFTGPGPEFTTTVDELSSAFGEAASMVEQYAQGLQQQAAISIAATDAARMLTSGNIQLNDVFSTGMGFLDQYNLNVFEQKAAYEALGLATNQITEADIKHGDALRELANMAAAGTISWDEYADSLVKVSQGQDAAKIASEATNAALEAARIAAHDWSLQAEDIGVTGTAVQLEDVQAQLAEYQELLAQASGQVETEFATNLDAGVLDKMSEYVDLITGVPPDVESLVSADTKTAFNNVDTLVKRIGLVQDKQIKIQVDVEVNNPSGYPLVP